MSAYVVENHVIDFALSAFVEVCRDSGRAWIYLDSRDGNARHYKIEFDSYDVLNEIGGLILAENVASVAYRYNEPAEPADYKFRQHRGVYGNDRRKLVAQAIKAIECIEYQSCEHPAWQDSDARQILNSMARQLSSRGLRSEAAEWGAPPHLPDGVGPISIFDMARKGRAA